jgi:hypothetical protein
MIQQESATLKILKFITENSGGKAAESFLSCHSIEDRQIPLCGRAAILKTIQTIWDLRKRSFGNSSNRTDYRYPICVGIPGVGKTRMLEEWGHIFDGIGITETAPRMGLLVLYFNGHGICHVDIHLPIKKTFAWRILHRYFFEGSEFEPFMKKLQNSNVYEDISIEQSILTVVAARNMDLSSREPLSFFLGIDEYQSITGNEEDGSDKLDYLMTALYQATLALVQHNVHLYIMFAGTEWSRLYTTSSSRDLCQKVYIPFSQNYTPIAASLYPLGLQSEVFQQCLFTIGGIPRNVVAFSREVRSVHMRLQRCPSARKIAQIRNAMYDTNSNQWTSLLCGESMITLAAFSLSGTFVNPDSSSGIVVSGFDGTPTWQQLADRGLFALVTDSDGCTSVTIPYTVIQQILTTVPPPSARRELTYFLRALRHIHTLPSQPQLEPWQKWKLFGAYFHSLRINACMLLGYEHIPLAFLFRGCKSMSIGMQDVEVVLRPATVHFSGEQLSEETNLFAVPEQYNHIRTVNVQEGEDCLVVVNGTNGRGVDIYFMLQTKNADDPPFIFLDQRKRESKSLTTGVITKYCDSMPCFADRNVRVVHCIFSALASYGKRSVQFPLQSPCVVLARQDLTEYHSSLALHPCARCVIDPHSANKSQLFSVLRNHMTDAAAKGLATEIKDVCTSNYFRTFESLCEAISLRQLSRSLDVALKFQLYFVDDDDEDDDDDDDEVNDLVNEFESQVI